MRTVDADFIIQKLTDLWAEKAELGRDLYLLGGAIAIVNDAPTIETVKYGEWEESPCFDYCFWVCTNCEFPSEAIAAPSLYKYCPNCGAIMTGTKPRKEKQNESRSRKQIQCR